MSYIMYTVLCYTAWGFELAFYSQGTGFFMRNRKGAMTHSFGLREGCGNGKCV